MPDGGDGMTVRTLRRIDDLSSEAWDACAGPDDPFTSHAFLSILERSGSTGASTGWTPRHLVLESANGIVLGCAPLYLKNHSFGEYVFDWSWAQAYERTGRAYYPKLQCAVPFTPVTGRRLLVRPGAPAGTERLLAEAMIEVARRLDVSSLHVTFPTESEARSLAAAGFLPRLGQQYHWLNRGYRDFDDFLADLSSRKRKAIRKERERVAQSGLAIRTLTGDAIEPHHWDSFYRFYRNTGDRKWGHPYLTRDFFRLLGERMADRVVLVLGERDARPVAGALNLMGGDALYGRYWGAVEDHAFLHFECCYYRAIEFAIERRLARVEAGAQGEHKIQRGYLPHPTHSAHWIADERFRRVIAHFLESERAMVAEEMTDLAAMGPFRHGAHQ